MSSEEKKQGEFPAHTKKPDCLLCKRNKETFGNTAQVCYEVQSSSPVAGEDTKRF